MPVPSAPRENATLPLTGEATAGDGTADGADTNVVELRVAARARTVSTVRAMAAHLAGQADLEIDAISDLCLAIDEACDSLIHVAAPGATLRCVFTTVASAANSMDPGAVRVEVATVARSDEGLDTAGFGWQLLRALTDRPRLVRSANGTPGSVAIRFSAHTAPGRP